MTFELCQMTMMQRNTSVPHGMVNVEPLGQGSLSQISKMLLKCNVTTLALSTNGCLAKTLVDGPLVLHLTLQVLALWPLKMHCDQNPSCENHDAGPIERVPVDCSQHMENMRNAKQNKRKIQKGATAMRTQLSQMSVPHHGAAHLAAAIEQHAHMLSTVVTRDSSTDTWEADWRRRPKAHAKVRRQAARRPMKHAALRTKQTTRVMPVTMDQMQRATHSLFDFLNAHKI